MSRLEHLREQIATREAELATLEVAYGHAFGLQSQQIGLAIDQKSDELFQLRAEAEEIEADIAMREARRDRAYAEWQRG